MSLSVDRAPDVGEDVCRWEHHLLLELSPPEAEEAELSGSSLSFHIVLRRFCKCEISPVRPLKLFECFFWGTFLGFVGTVGYFFFGPARWLPSLSLLLLADLNTTSLSRLW